MATKTLIDEFKKNLEKEVLDPKGTHHEFVSGMHGRKLDFDVIQKDSNLFREWVKVVAQYINDNYGDVPRGKLALLSVANGTNRLVEPVAKELGGGVAVLLTGKISPKAVKLTDGSANKLKKLDPDLVIAIEDVGTKGTTSASAVVSARENGAKKAEALNTWQRRSQLEELEAIGATYHSIIHENLPTYEPEECKTNGYCSKSWKFIKHA